MASDGHKVSSVSPDTADPAHLSPELMNISPLTGDTPAEESSQPAGKQVLDQIQQQEWLLEQKTQLEAQLTASKPGFGEELAAMSPEELEKLCETLQAELLVKSEVHDTRQALAKSERLNQTAMSLLKATGSGTDTNSTLQSLFTEMSQLAEEVGKQHKENVDLQAELDRCKKENRDLQQKSRDLYDQIGTKKKEKEEELDTLTNDPSGRSIKADLKTKLDVHKVQSNVLQKLILGSGANWMEDEKLKSIVLECGQSVDI